MGISLPKREGKELETTYFYEEILCKMMFAFGRFDITLLNYVFKITNKIRNSLAWKGSTSPNPTFYKSEGWDLGQVMDYPKFPHWSLNWVQNPDPLTRLLCALQHTALLQAKFLAIASELYRGLVTYIKSSSLGFSFLTANYRKTFLPIWRVKQSVLNKVLWIANIFHLNDKLYILQKYGVYIFIKGDFVFYIRKTIVR